MKRTVRDHPKDNDLGIEKEGSECRHINFLANIGNLRPVCCIFFFFLALSRYSFSLRRRHGMFAIRATANGPNECVYMLVTYCTGFR